MQYRIEISTSREGVAKIHLPGRSLELEASGDPAAGWKVAVFGPQNPPQDDAMSTTRHPYRVLSAPAAGIASIEPTPRHKSTNPRFPSPNLALVFANGTIQAHEAETNPTTKNVSLVARRS